MRKYARHCLVALEIERHRRLLPKPERLALAISSFYVDSTQRWRRIVRHQLAKNIVLPCDL